MNKIFTFLMCMVVSTTMVFSQVTLTADGPGNTYELINGVFAPGYYAVEVPDCGHTDFGRHIEEVWDADLNSNVFVFHIHTDDDNDRCQKYDRQRNEIKTYDQSPDNLIGTLGETVIYNWKFKLDAGFQPSSSFTHIHQIKAVGGPEAGLPQISFTLRKGSPDKLELRYAETTSQSTISSTDLTPFKGEWVEVTETITYGESGSYDLSIVKVSDGSTLFTYSDSSIRMWMTDADFMRPKWGIYRSLNNSHQLRDEAVRYADFSIEEVIEGGACADADNDGVCDDDDVCAGIDDGLLGTACDDGDACTTGETYNSNCACTGGVFQDADNDNVCDVYDACSGTNDNLIGTACDDGDPCTIGETYDANCNCMGTLIPDSDSDGVCNFDDVCPNFDDTLIGTPCNDGDLCTSGDVYLSDCTCAGTYLDADGDGICDVFDDCVDSYIIYEETFANTLGSYSVVSGAFSSPKPTYENFTQQSGSIELQVGGVDNTTQNDMSLAISTSFSANGVDNYYVDVEYILNANQGYEPDEWTQVILSVDGQVISHNGNNYLSELVGGSPSTTGAVSANVVLAGLSAGSHTLTIGILNNKKTYATELSVLIINSININTDCPSCNPALVGTACDDGDPCTTGETYNATCDCSGGVSTDTDADGVCDALDICQGSDDSLIGTACDDDNPCTSGETYDANCSCSGGTIQDADNDNVCDASDVCPGFDDDLIGTTCDDGDPCTTGETYNGSCNCSGGVSTDTDADGVCDALDICQGSDDSLIGTACDDGDPCTTGETYDANCGCSGGTFQDADNDNVCDASDVCPGFDDDLIGTTCDDGDPCTINDIYLSDCSCVGIFLDSDNNGICDADEFCTGPSPVYEESFSNSLGNYSVVHGAFSSPNTTYENFIQQSGSVELHVGGVDKTTQTDLSFAISTSFSANGTDDYYVDLEYILNTDDDYEPDEWTKVLLSVDGQLVNYNGNSYLTQLAGGTPETSGIVSANLVLTGLSAGTHTLTFGILNNKKTTNNELSILIINSINIGIECTNCNSALAGTACDDGDACTTGETYDSDCNCVGGIFEDADNDEVCAANDVDDNDFCQPIPCNTCTTINSNDFENGLNIWNDGGGDCYLLSNTTYANSGSKSVRLRDNSGSSSSLYSDDLNLNTYNLVEISFSYITNSMETNEDFFLEYSTNGGSNYTIVEDWIRGTDFSNNTRYNELVTINGPFSSNTKFRFRCDASANADQVYIDDVVIVACGSVAPRPTANPVVNIANTLILHNVDILENEHLQLEEDVIISPIDKIHVKSITNSEEVSKIKTNELKVSVFPNPLQNEFTLLLNELVNNGDLVIVNSVGQSVYKSALSVNHTLYKIDASNFKAGVYMVYLIDKTSTTTIAAQKIIKY